MASAALIDQLERDLKVRFAEEFDLFVGTSTGGLIALGLASGMSGAELVDLYERLAPMIFPRSCPRRMLRYGRWMIAARYSHVPLESALKDQFGTTTLGDIRAAGRLVAVPAFNWSTRQVRVFKTDHHADLTTDSKIRLADVARATSAAPTYFPPAELPRYGDDGVIEQYVDGGLFANNPALVAYVEAIHYLGTAPADLRLLSIGASPSRAAGLPRRSRRVFTGGAIEWSVAPTVMIDAGMQSAEHMVDLLLRTHNSAARVYARALIDTGGFASKMDDSHPDVVQQLRRLGGQRGTDPILRASVRGLLDLGDSHG